MYRGLGIFFRPLYRNLVILDFFVHEPVFFSQDHVRLWSAERAVSAVLIPVSILPFIYTTPATDALFCTLAVLHSHWGIEVFQLV